MHEYSTSLMVTARMEGLLHVAKKVSAVNSVICNVAWLTVTALKSLVTWTDLFNVMANSDGHMSIRTEIVLSSVSIPHLSLHFLQSTWCAGPVCWTGVQNPHWLCVTGLLQLTVPVCVAHNVFLPVLCRSNSVAWGCADETEHICSVTFWWQSCTCNCSTLFMCHCSGSPHNVMQSSTVEPLLKDSPN